MAKYIECEAVLAMIRPDDPNDERCAVTVATAKRLIRHALTAAPAADVAPVVHARWEWFDEETGTPSTGYEREWGWRCSHCGEELSDDYDDPDDSPTFRFCYNCGAMMNGGVDNEAN